MSDGDERPLSILVVTQYFWPENFQINHIVRGLRDRGHKVTVLTGKPNYPAGRFFDGYGLWSRTRDVVEGIPVHRVPLAPRGKAGAFRLGLNYLSFAFSASVLGPFLAKGRYDAIFVYAPSPITVGLPAIAMKGVTGARVAIWVQDLWPESVVAGGGVRSPALLGLLDRLVRFIYARCDHILVQSRGFVPRIKAQGVTEDRIFYFPQSVDTLFVPVAPSEAPDEQALMPKGFNVLFAGNVGHAQNFETVIAAAELLRDRPEIHWVIVGDGRRSEWLAEEISRRGLTDQVHLLGRYPETAMPKFFAHADALLVSLRKEPIFALTVPTKVQAYLACGKPVLACLDGEGARIVEEAGAGRAVAAGDHEALARAVVSLFEAGEGGRAEMGKRALAYSDRDFNRDVLIARLEDILRNGSKGSKDASKSTS